MIVKVHNLNIHPHREAYRGTIIEIPAGAYVEMDEDDADYFLQQFTFPKKDSQERPDPRFFKKLKIERPPRAAKDDDDLMCHANGKRAASREELADLIKGFKHMLASAEDTPEELRAEMKTENVALRKENTALKTRLEAIEARLGLTAEEPQDDNDASV